MRKLLLFPLVLTFLASCVTDGPQPETTPPQTDPVTVVDPYVVPLEDALSEMHILMEKMYGAGTRSATRSVDGVITLSRSGAKTRSTSLNEPVAYVVNFVDDGGFSVIGALREPYVVCITESGSFTEEDIERIEDDLASGIVNNSDSEWMSYKDIHYSIYGDKEPFVYEDYCIDWDEGDEMEVDNGDYPVYSLDDEFDFGLKKKLYTLVLDDEINLGDDNNNGFNNDYTTPLAYEYREFITEKKIGPLLKTKWSQDYPFNGYCYLGYPLFNPSTKIYYQAGCVAIALAQIIAFNEKPAPSYFNSSITSTWAELKNHKYNMKESDKTPIDHRIEDDLAKIIRVIGAGVNMDYGVESSGSTDGAAKRYLKKKMGYNNVKKKLGYEECTIMDMLNKGLPVYIGASNTLSKGHSWVIDGSYFYQRELGVYLDGFLHSMSVGTPRFYLHCNFGWGCLANGYYYSGVFDPTKGAEFTEDGKAPDVHSGSAHYKKWYRIVKYTR